jgi:ketosteroid isomerase-like protein
MTAKDNKLLARETMEAFIRWDVEAALVNVAEDVVWTIPGAAGRDLVGKDAMRKFRTDNAGLFLELERKIVGEYSDANTVVLEVSVKGRLKNGTPYENAVCHVWEFDNGRIVRCREYADTEKGRVAFQQLS